MKLTRVSMPPIWLPYPSVSSRDSMEFGLELFIGKGPIFGPMDCGRSDKRDEGLWSTDVIVWR